MNRRPVATHTVDICQGFMVSSLFASKHLDFLKKLLLPSLIYVIHIKLPRFHGSQDEHLI